MRASPVAQMVKNMPAMQETWVLSLGQKDPLEKKMATHSSILAQRISWTEEPGGLQSMESPAKSQMTQSDDWATCIFTLKRWLITFIFMFFKLLIYSTNIYWIFFVCLSKGLGDTAADKADPHCHEARAGVWNI